MDVIAESFRDEDLDFCEGLQAIKKKKKIISLFCWNLSGPKHHPLQTDLYFLCNKLHGIALHYDDCKVKRGRRKKMTKNLLFHSAVWM